LAQGVPDPRFVGFSLEPVSRLGFASRNDNVKVAITIEIRQGNPACSVCGTGQGIGYREMRPPRPTCPERCLLAGVDGRKPYGYGQ
jgi:hypothetical protein